MTITVVSDITEEENNGTAVVTVNLIDDGVPLPVLIDKFALVFGTDIERAAVPSVAAAGTAATPSAMPRLMSRRGTSPTACAALG